MAKISEKIKVFLNGREKGQIIIMALVLPVVFISVLVAMTSWASSVTKMAIVTQNKNLAVQIAEAGANYYRWHLAHAPQDYQDGTGAAGPYTHDYKDRDGNVVGRFVLDITPPPIGSTVVKIKSTGYALNHSEIKRSVLVTEGKPSIAKYAWAIGGNVVFGDTSEIFGPIQVNGGVQFNGIAHNLVSSSQECYNDPDSNPNPVLGCQRTGDGTRDEEPGVWSGTDARATSIVGGGAVTGVNIISGGSTYSSPPAVSFFASLGSGASGTAVVGGGRVTGVNITGGGSGYTAPPVVLFTGGNSTSRFFGGKKIGVPAADFTRITADLSDIQSQTVSGASKWGPSAPAQGYHIVLRTDGTFNLYKVTSLKPQGSCYSPPWGINAENYMGNFPFPANGLIFIEDNLWVEGALDTARLTIAAARFNSNPASIIINNSITYAHTDGSEVLGLIAEKDVIIGLYSQTNLTIDAAVIAKNGKFNRPCYSNSSCWKDESPPEGAGRWVSSSCGPDNLKSSLTTSGMIASYLRSAVWYGDNGYQNRQYNYDGNLLYAPPPSFPLTADQYEIISWQEVKN